MIVKVQHIIGSPGEPSKVLVYNRSRSFLKVMLLAAFSDSTNLGYIIRNRERVYLRIQYETPKRANRVSEAVMVITEVLGDKQRGW